ncbi:MAG: TetR/AcrR family transcriptional regulator [Solirubrobacterales bacterium]
MDLRRQSLIRAMATIVAEQGYEGASVAAVCARAGVSRRTFNREFGSREECFLAVLEEGYRHAVALIAETFGRAEAWEEGIREALSRLLSFFDSDPELAQVLLVESASAGTWSLRYREARLLALAKLIVDAWDPAPGAATYPQAAPSVMASVLALLQSHLLAERPEPLLSLLGPVMAIVTGPYLSRSAVLAEVEKTERLAGIMIGNAPLDSLPETEIPDFLLNPRAQRARQALLHLVENGGSSNREVAEAIGIGSHTQISTLLSRLLRLGLLVKHPGRPGHPNRWEATKLGVRVSRALNEPLHSTARGKVREVTS